MSPTDTNPYRAPSANLGARAEAAAEGDILLYEEGAELPPFCVRCDAPSVGQHTAQRRQLGTLFWFALFFIWPLSLVYYFVTARIQLSLPYCASCQRLIRLAPWALFGLLVASIALVPLVGLETRWTVVAIWVVVGAGFVWRRNLAVFDITDDPERNVRTCEVHGASLDWLARLPQREEEGPELFDVDEV